MASGNCRLQIEDIEPLLSESEPVKSAVALGDSRFELGVVVEPAVPHDVDDFKSVIWLMS